MHSQPANLGGAHAHPRVALDQHAQQLADLIDVVARLPARHGAREDVARRGQRIHRARGDAAAVALLPDDAEVAELEAAAVADEDVQRREVAVERLAAVQLAEHLEDARDLAARRRLGPALRRARQERAQVAVPRVLERRGSTATRPSARISGKVSNTRIARGCASSSWPKYASRSQPSMRPLTLMQTVSGTAAERPIAPGEVDLAEAAFAEQPLDPVSQAGFRADDGFRRTRAEIRRRIGAVARRA